MTVNPYFRKNRLHTHDVVLLRQTEYHCGQFQKLIIQSLRRNQGRLPMIKLYEAFCYEKTDVELFEALERLRKRSIIEFTQR